MVTAVAVLKVVAAVRVIPIRHIHKVLIRVVAAVVALVRTAAMQLKDIVEAVTVVMVQHLLLPVLA